MHDVTVIEDPAAAESSLDPIRARLLAELAEPGPATTLAAARAAYVLSPTALSAVAPDPSHEPDQRSARWLLAVAGRMVREVGELITGASAAGKPLAPPRLDRAG